jgi:hypothetical protein
VFCPDFEIKVASTAEYFEKSTLDVNIIYKINSYGQKPK